MGRPIYPYELGDPDFSWLISNFQETHPEYCVIENTCLPVVFIEQTELTGEIADIPLPTESHPREGTEPEEQEIP